MYARANRSSFKYYHIHKSFQRTARDARDATRQVHSHSSFSDHARQTAGQARNRTTSTQPVRPSGPQNQATPALTPPPGVCIVDCADLRLRLLTPYDLRLHAALRRILRSVLFHSTQTSDGVLETQMVWHALLPRNHLP